MTPGIPRVFRGSQAEEDIWKYLWYVRPSPIMAGKRLTMEFAEGPVLLKGGRCNSMAIVFYGAIPAAVVNRDVDLGRASIQRVLEQTAYHAVQRCYDGRRLDLCNNIPRKRLYRHVAGVADMAHPVDVGRLGAGVGQELVLLRQATKATHQWSETTAVRPVIQDFNPPRRECASGGKEEVEKRREKGAKKKARYDVKQNQLRRTKSPYPLRRECPKRTLKVGFWNDGGRIKFGDRSWSKVEPGDQSGVPQDAKAREACQAGARIHFPGSTQPCVARRSGPTIPPAACSPLISQ